RPFIAGVGQRLRTPSGRSHLREREGSTKDINRDYVEVESEVIAQIIHDIEVAKVIKKEDDQFNIADEVKRMVSSENRRRFERIVNRIEDEAVKNFILLQMGHLNGKIRWGFETLSQLAADD